MTKREIAVVACRVLSIYFIVQAIISIPVNLSLFAFTRENLTGESGMLIMNWGATVLILISGIVLWLLAGAIAKPMTADHGEQTNRSTLNASGYLIVASTTIGLYFLATATINIVASAIEIKILAREIGNTWWHEFISDLVHSSRFDFIPNVVQLALGLWLLLGSRGLVNFLTRRGEVASQ